jgi:hypothetical protein
MKAVIPGLLMLASVLGPSLSSGQAAQKPFPTPEQQIAVSVMALPPNMQAGATVMGWKSPTGKLEVLRQGTNGMNCLAQFAIEPRFHVSCYHEGMEPFMLRGRQLREQGITVPEKLDSVRYLEVSQGKIRMPGQAALYQIIGDSASWEPTTGALSRTRLLFVIYIPGATEASSGLPTRPPANGAPWLMNAGTPKAHIMFTPTMR